MKSNFDVVFSRRHWLRAGCGGGIGLLLPACLRAVESDPERTAIKLITPDTDRAIARGVAYLAEQQTEDGAFGTSGYQRNVAICALSGMALMASGSTPGRGPYGKQIDRCVD